MEVEQGFQLNRALATLSFAVEKTRPTPRLKFGDIIAQAQENILQRKNTASGVPYSRRMSMNELVAEQYLDFSFDDDEEDEEDDNETQQQDVDPLQQAASSHAAAARSFSCDSKSFKDLQRKAASRSTMALVTSSPDPVVAALKNKSRLMQDVKVHAGGLQVVVPKAHSFLRTPSLHSPPSQPLQPTRQPSASPLPGFSGSDTLLEQLQAVKPVASRRFSSIDLGRPSRLQCHDPENPEPSSPSTLTPSSVLGITDRGSGFNSGQSSIDGRSRADSPVSLSRRVSVHSIRSESELLQRPGTSDLDQPLCRLAAGGGGRHKAVARRNTLACMLPRHLAQPPAPGSGAADAPVGGREADSDSGSCARGLHSSHSLGVAGAMSSNSRSGLTGVALIARLRRQSVTFCPQLRDECGAGAERLPPAACSPSAAAQAAPEREAAGAGGAWPGAEPAAAAAAGSAEKLPTLPRIRL